MLNIFVLLNILQSYFKKFLIVVENMYKIIFIILTIFKYNPFNNSLFSLPWPLTTTFYFRSQWISLLMYLMYVESYSICLFVIGLFHLA